MNCKKRFLQFILHFPRLRIAPSVPCYAERPHAASKPQRVFAGFSAAGAFFSSEPHPYSWLSLPAFFRSLPIIF
ncbi:MAG: hypothetical protein ACLR8U_01745 [Oscillospiraceae bacterium]